MSDERSEAIDVDPRPQQHEQATGAAPRVQHRLTRRSTNDRNQSNSGPPDRRTRPTSARRVRNARSAQQLCSCGEYPVHLGAGKALRLAGVATGVPKEPRVQMPIVASRARRTSSGSKCANVSANASTAAGSPHCSTKRPPYQWSTPRFRASHSSARRRRRFRSPSQHSRALHVSPRRSFFAAQIALNQNSLAASPTSASVGGAVGRSQPVELSTTRASAPSRSWRTRAPR